MQFSLHKGPLTLRAKFILLTCGMTLITSLVISLFVSARLTDQTSKAAIEKLGHETKLTAELFKSSYIEMSHDILFARQTPPISGIIRTRNGEKDPQDGSTNELWRERLDYIFKSIMKDKPYYTQMRYIGIHDGGRELVRVNRIKSELVTVPIENLQRKATEPYYKEALKAHIGDILISNVSYNREYGKISSDYTPTVRLTAPVFSNNKLFGMVVINANYELLLKHILKKIAPTNDTFIINSSGGAMQYDRKANHYNFYPPEKKLTDLPKIIQGVMNTSTNENTFSDHTDYAYLVFTNILSGVSKINIAVISVIPKRILLAEAVQTVKEAFVIQAVLATLCFIIAALVSGRITRQLKSVAEKIRLYNGDNVKELNLPTKQPDEIGQLACAFETAIIHLHRSEAKLQAIFSSAADGVLTLDSNAYIESFNPACQALFGYTAKDVIGKNIHTLIHNKSSNALLDYLGFSHTHGNTHRVLRSLEVVAVRKDNSQFHAHISLSHTLIDGATIFVGLIRDITEEKRMQRMKDEFVSTVNHEIRTPLTSIRGALSLLKHTTADTIDEKGKKLLNISLSNCERLSTLVNDILDIEKIAAGKMTYSIERLEISSLIQEIIEANDIYAHTYGVQFVFIDNIKHPTFCFVDKNRFHQALTNILSNAAKFSPQGETVQLSLSLKNDKYIHISVKDKGPGIPFDFRKNIFKKFAQADSSSVRKSGGSGLGLSITKPIIEAFNGTINFESKEGEGTTFFFTLPIDKKVAITK